MKKRIAAHYIWHCQVYKMHYIELDEQDSFLSVNPLNEELAGTEFYNGIIFPVLFGVEIDESSLPEHWMELTRLVKPKMRVKLYHLDSLSQATTKFGTNDSSGCPHIKRL